MKKLVVSLLFLCLFFSSRAQISIKKLNGGFLILDHHQEIAFYQKESKKTGSVYQRNNYLYPFFLPGEIAVNGNSPGNTEQQGIFWGWPQIRIDGKQICDSWNNNDFINKIKTVEFSRNGDGSGVLSVTGYWSSPKFRGGEYEFLKEQTTIIFHQQTGNYRQIDFQIKLYPRVSELELGRDRITQAGGFAIRMKMPRNVRFYSSEGRIKPGTKVIKAPGYTGIQGSFDSGDKTGGIIIYAAHDNHREKEQQQWLFNHKEGLQNALFPSSSSIRLSQDHPLELKYSLVLYHGKIGLRQIIRKLEKQQE